jgi:hypothetical protein
MLANANSSRHQIGGEINAVSHGSPQFCDVIEDVAHPTVSRTAGGLQEHPSAARSRGPEAV